MDRHPFASSKNDSGSAQLPTGLGTPMSINHSFSVNNPTPFDKNDLTIYFDSFLNKTNHPYFLGPFLFRSEKSNEHDFIITFAVTLFLVSLDFYLVKNITGRFLVKMIWWIDANEDYSNKIIFKSSEESLLNGTDKKVFLCSKEQHKVVGTFLNRINLSQLYKKVFSG